MARVAVDAMGGDLAPEQIVAGALAAASEGVEITLVGREDDIRAHLPATPSVDVVHAPDVIAMDDPDPARAVRTKRDSSLAVAAKLVKDDRADAMFSAGSTGAAMAAAVLGIGRIRGVGRPALAVVLPFPTGPTVMIDAGANTDVRAEHLAGFAVLGSVFAGINLGIDEPRIGLLSIGEEPGKGNELAKAAYPLLAGSGLNFIGNIEGRDIPSPDVDVVVTDGFTGNVALKLMEGFGGFVMRELMKIFASSDEAKAAADVLMPSLLELAGALDPDTTGGAHLLGVKGVCIIGHGSSKADAVKAATVIASRTADADLVSGIAGRLSGGTT